jgi:copper chaperone
MSQTITYAVPGIHCGRCETAVKQETSAVFGVESVHVDLGAKLVTITGERLDDAALRTAIGEAGYEVANQSA